MVASDPTFLFVTNRDFRYGLEYTLPNGPQTHREFAFDCGYLSVSVVAMTSPDRRRLGLFLGILFLAAITLSIAHRTTDYGILTLASVYMFSPLVAGVIVCVTHGISFSSVGVRLGRPRWLLISTLIALPLVGLTLLIAVVFPGVTFSTAIDPIPGIAFPRGPAGVVAAFGLVLVLGATVNAVFAFGEEFGWRGYLLWELAPLGFWRASILIGGVWGLWHAPAIVAGYNYPSFPYVGVLAMVIAGIALSPVYTYVVLKAKSVLAAALLHGVFNGSAGIVIAFASTEDVVLRELVASPVGLAGVIAFGLAATVIGLRGPPELSRDRVAGDQSAR